MKVFIHATTILKAAKEVSEGGAGMYAFEEKDFALTNDLHEKLFEKDFSTSPDVTRSSLGELTKSMVNHPSHYNSGKIEVIEAIEDWKLNYHLGNTVKYVARAGRKDPTKEIEDLEKAAWYLKRKIELLKAEKEQREATRPNDMNPKV